MKILSKLGRFYCLASAGLVAVVAVGLGVAFGLGFVPDGSLEKIVTALEREPKIDDAVVEVSRKKTPTEVALDVEKRQAPDVRLWSRRLEQVGEGIQKDLAELDGRLARMKSEEQRLSRVSEILTQVLSNLLGEEITADELLASADEVVRTLEEQRRDEMRKPWMLDTLKSMEPRAIATLFSGASAEGEQGLKEGEAVELLGGLPPRKAGQVLAEMGKVDPTRAARLLALMGRGEPLGDGSVTGGQVR